MSAEKIEEVTSMYHPCVLISRDRNNSRSVARYEIDLSKASRNQKTLFVEVIPRPKAPEILKPDLEWQIEQVAKFIHIRLYISRLLENRSQWPEIQKIYIRQSPEEWKNFFENNEPTLLSILGVDNNLYDLGIDHLTDTFDDIKCGDTIPYKSGQWLYALLACINQPMHLRSTSVLRILSRRCTEIRSQINLENENAKKLATPLNLFICLVARYFKQFDIAD